jgi:hypothetical protein
MALFFFQARGGNCERKERREKKREGRRMVVRDF